MNLRKLSSSISVQYCFSMIRYYFIIIKYLFIILKYYFILMQYCEEHTILLYNNILFDQVTSHRVTLFSHIYPLISRSQRKPSIIALVYPMQIDQSQVQILLEHVLSHLMIFSIQHTCSKHNKVLLNNIKVLVQHNKILLNNIKILFYISTVL